MSDDPENTGQTRDTRFKPGQSGNPAGKPKGSRHKLGEAFVSALHDDFQAHGVEVIEKVRTERPQDYMKVVASLLPKEFKIETTSDLTDEQLDARIRALADLLEIGVGGSSGRAPETQGEEQAQRLPPVH